MLTPSRSVFVLVAVLYLSNAAYSQVQQSWVQRWAMPGNDIPVAIKTNGSAVYVLAQVNAWTSSSNVILIKYNSAGTIQWTQYYNSPANNSDVPTNMVLDGAGNIYVIGKSTVLINNGSTSETFTLKYNSSGVLQWGARYLRPDTYPSELNSIAVDPAGNVYVSGSTINGDAFAYDFMTIKYNSNGVQQWMRTYNGTGNGVDMGTRIALDATGNVIVTGESLGQLRKGRVVINTFADVYTIKYDPNGNTLWARRYNAFNKRDVPQAIAVDPSGNIYITGESGDAANYYDFLTLKYDTNGSLLWTARYNGSANLHDGAEAIAVNGAGEVHVTGYTNPSGTVGYDFKTIKYNASGALLWEASYNGAANGSDIAIGLGMDAFGAIYVTGEVNGSFNRDFATVKYSSNGIQQWAATYNGTGNGSDSPAGIAVYTPSGPVFQNASIYVTGQSAGADIDIATVKYTQPMVIGFASTTSQPLSNYPNPFTGNTTIEYELQKEGNIYLRVVDVMTGREVESISLGQQSSGKQSYVYQPRGLRKGNYVYHIINESVEGRSIETKIMRIDD